MKRAGFLLLVLALQFCCSDRAKSQQLSTHAWIRPHQKYFRFGISQSGLYQLTGPEMAQVGIPADSVPIENFQIFRRGRELPLEIDKGTDQQGNAIHSIRFYAQKNDGAADSILYVNPLAQPHPFYSLYTDTASYFLTWRTDSIARRMPVADRKATGTGINFHIDEEKELRNSFYAPGNFYPPGTTFDTGVTLSSYDAGEGWTGQEIRSGQSSPISLQTTDIEISSLALGSIDLTLAGRSAGINKVKFISGSRVISSLELYNYNPGTIHIPLSDVEIGTDGKIALRIQIENGSASLSAINWRYPRKNRAGNASQAIFTFPPAISDKNWQYRHLSNTTLYHCPNMYDVEKIRTSPDSTLPLTDISKIVAVREFFKVPQLTPVSFANPISSNTEFLIISHPAVRDADENISDPVAAYASYRSSHEGGSYRTAVVNIQDVYDRFNYGDRSPVAISNLIRELNTHGHLKFVLLIGRSVDPQSVRKIYNPGAKDMIPNAGWPGSDMALVMKPGLMPEDFVPLVPIGRLNASSYQEVWTYLQKVKAFEANASSARWRKHVLHLSGGRSVSELGLFKSYVQSYGEKLEESGMDVTTLSKRTDDPVEQFPLDTYLNPGVALMTLFGHSGINVTDLDIGYASDSSRNYRNAPYFPAVIVNGCATGSIFYSPATISQDWIFAPHSGSVLFLAHTSNGVSDALHRYTTALYETLRDTAFMSAPFGAIQKEAIRRNMQRTTLISDFSTAQQMTLHGDPAIRIFPAKFPDYTFDTTQIELAETKGEPLSGKSDSLRVRLGIFNNGRVHTGNYQLLLRRTFDTGETTDESFHFPAVMSADTITLSIIRKKSSNREKWHLFIDPDHQIAEENEQNNELIKWMDWPSRGAEPLIPVDRFITSSHNIELVASVPEERSVKQVIFEWDANPEFRSAEKQLTYATGPFASVGIETPATRPDSIFWRVYLVDDDPAFASVRKILLSSDTLHSVDLPEVVAAIAAPTLTSVQEGDVFRLNADFTNVTAVPFSDSVKVTIASSNLLKSTLTSLKIAPLAAFEKRTFSIDQPSTGRTGVNDVLLTFNADRLPEQIYSNNLLRYTYKVIPDLIRPVLSVQVDNRHLTENENVSPRPVFNVGLIDENPFLLLKDTSSVNVLIREDCPSCPEKRMSLRNAEISRQAPNALFLEVMPESRLNSGQYILTVKGRDITGNLALPYTIGFVVSDTLKIVDAGVSPVPAHQWFRFYLNFEGQPKNIQWKIVVKNLMGKVIHETETAVHPGKNELIWRPLHVPPGLLLYRMKLSETGLIPHNQAGNGLTGKMLWLPD